MAYFVFISLKLVTFSMQMEMLFVSFTVFTKIYNICMHLEMLFILLIFLQNFVGVVLSLFIY